MKQFLVISFTFIVIGGCQSDSSSQDQYVPNSQSEKLNNEAVTIISETLGKDSLDLISLNIALDKLNEAISLDSQYHYSYLNRATVYKTLGHYEETLKEYEKASEFDRNNPELFLTQGIINEKLGKLNKATDMYFEAIKIYNARIIEHPENIHFKISRSYLFLFTHDKDEALAQIHKIDVNNMEDKEKVNLMISIMGNFNRESFIDDF